MKHIFEQGKRLHILEKLKLIELVKKNVLTVIEQEEYHNKHRLHFEFSRLNLHVQTVLEHELFIKKIEKFSLIDDLKIKKRLWI